jgi:hypothetical protein
VLGGPKLKVETNGISAKAAAAALYPFGRPSGLKNSIFRGRK